MSKGTLLEKISEPSHLKTAWKKLNKGRGDSRGLSSETIKQFQDQLDANIDVVSKSLRAGTYRFQKTRGVLIPKANKKEFRPLRIPDVRDRLVAKAASMVLDDILTPKYDLNNPCSFAYRKDRGVHTAIAKLAEHYRAGKIFILEADIEKFFDNVDRESLLKQLSTQLPDNSLDAILQAALIQEIGNLEDHPDTAHYFEDSNDGIPQGNCLSPLLANVYLSGFDARMQAEGFALVRYADDFIVLCSDINEAMRALQVAKEELEQNLPLKVHPLGKPDDHNAKTRIVDPRFHPFHFLSIGFDGRELWVHRKKVEGLKEKLLEATTVSRGSTLLKALTRVRNVLEGWLASFKFVPVEKNAEEIDDYVNVQLCNLMRFLEFPLRTSSTALSKRSGGEVQCLSSRQRRNSGIKTCEEFLNSIENRGLVKL